jgi:hypothetical protein
MDVRTVTETVTETATETVTKLIDRLDPRSFEMPKFELPKFELPRFQLPDVELPKVELPDADRVVALVRDAAYVGVGAAVVGAQEVDDRVRATVRRVVAAVR